MDHLARIAQMESSRFVGGRAQTQALLRAPDKTSRQDIGRGRFDRPAGSRGAVTKYTSGAEIVRLPAGSIVSIGPFESPDLSHSGLNKPLLFALAINVLCWGFILLAGRGIASVFL